jgi:hypothetical protein
VILPAEGSPITIVTIERTMMQMKVYALGGSPDFSIYAVVRESLDYAPDYAQLSPSDEGISWCRGHSGPDVDALKVALALS